MPIGVELRRKQHEKQETAETWDVRGEEGVFHIVQLGEERYYAKQWYKSHEKGMAVPVEKNASPVSPYFHKAKKFEYDLMHEAFPEHVIKMVSAHDERIKPDPNHPHEYNFYMGNGRPTTISLEAIGDPILCARRDQTMERAYAQLLPYIDSLRRQGRGTSPDDPFIKKWRDRVDEEMQKILGGDIHIRPIRLEIGSLESQIALKQAQSLIPKELEKLAAEMESKYKQNAIVKMLKCGILPTHPELNFIPGERNKFSEPPYGTFVELTIRDINKFIKMRRRNLERKPQELKRFEHKLSRYMLYRMLDGFFDDCVLMHNYGPKDRYKTEPVVQTALFKLTESIRSAVESGSMTIDPQQLNRIKKAVQGMFARGFNADHIATLLQTEITDIIKEQTQQHKKK